MCTFAAVTHLCTGIASKRICLEAHLISRSRAMRRCGQREELQHHAEAFDAELRGGPGISLGTTIMAATFGDGLDGGVVLGADTRTSSGNYIANRATDKITQLSDKVFVCRSGSAADTQNLAAYVQYYLNQHSISMGRDVDVKTAAMLVKQISYSNKEMLQAGLIVAGWDDRKGGSVWGVPLGGTLVEQPFTIGKAEDSSRYAAPPRPKVPILCALLAGGSGSAYIYGFCDETWRPGMSESECRDFVVQAVSHAMARDGSSGGNIRTVVISRRGVQRTFLDGTQVPLHFGELKIGSSSVAPMTA